MHVEAFHQNAQDPSEDEVACLAAPTCLEEGFAVGPCQGLLGHLPAELMLSPINEMKMGLQGVIGETYNIGTQKERQVIEVARDIAARFRMGEDKIVKVKDRAFNDQRYRACLSPGMGNTLLHIPQ